MQGLIGGIIGLAIGVIVFSTVLMDQIISTPTSYNVSGTIYTWSSAETSLWNTVGLVAVVGILVVMLRVFGVEA